MANNRKTVLVSISLLPELLAGLDWLAEQEGRSRSGEIAWLLAQANKANKAKKLKKRVATP